MSKPLYFTKADEKLIPPDKRALYRAGILSKEDIDAYLGESLKQQATEVEQRKQTNLAAPEEKEAPWGGQETDITDYISTTDEITRLNDQFAEARAEDQRLSYLEGIATDPEGANRRLEQLRANAFDRSIGNMYAKFQEDVDEANRLWQSGELWDRRNAAFAKQQEANDLLKQAEFKIQNYEKLFKSKGEYGRRLLADLGSNKESLYPLAGSIVGGAIGGYFSAGTGTSAGATIGSTIGSIPIYDKAYNAAYVSAVRGGVPESEAQTFAAAMAGSEAFIEAVAGRFGAGGSTTRQILKDSLYKRFGKKVAAAGLSEGIEELAAGRTQEAIGAGILSSEGTSEELKKQVAGEIPFKKDGTVDWQSYFGKMGREFSTGLAGGTVVGGLGAPVAIKAENKQVAERVSAARTALNNIRTSLIEQGVTGTELTNRLAQEATNISAAVGADAKDIFKSEDLLPDTTEVDQRIKEKVAGSLVENVRLRPEDPFTVGQMQAMQNIDLEKPFQKDGLKTSYKPLQATELLYQEPTTVEEGSFAVDVPVQPQTGFGVQPKTNLMERFESPQPQVTPTVGKTRVNLTAKIADMKATDQRVTTPESKVTPITKQPKVTKITATEGLTPKQLAQDNIFGLIQKTAAKEGKLSKNQQKALQNQQRNIQDATDEAERQLNFEDAFQGMTQDQQEGAIRRKALEFLSSGKKISDISYEFDTKTESVPSARQAQVQQAEQFLTRSDETRNRIAKDVGSPELVDALIRDRRITVAPTFEGKVVGGKPADNAQAFVVDGDKIVVNASKIGAKDAKEQLAYAVVAHEYSHKKERTKDRIPLLKQLEGEKAYGELNKAIADLSNKSGRLGDVARSAMRRAQDAVDGGYASDITQEAPQYFVEELLTSYDGPLGAVRKYVDGAISAVRNAATKLGVPLNVRPQDLAYIIKQDIVQEAKGKGKKAEGGETRFSNPYSNAPDNLMGYRKTGPQKSYTESNYKYETPVKVTWPDGKVIIDGMKGLNRPHALERARRNWPDAQVEAATIADYEAKWGEGSWSKDTGKVQFSIAYKNSPKARQEIKEGKGFRDIVYDQDGVEFSDKDATLNIDPMLATGSAKLGDVLQHDKLYEYYPKFKDYNIKFDPDPNMKWGEAYFIPSSNTVVLSERVTKTLKPEKKGEKVYQKIANEVLSAVIHETQHAIQQGAVMGEKGASLEQEGQKYTKRAILTGRAETDKSRRALREGNAAWWTYMANAGEAQARAVQAVFEGKYDTYREAIKAIESQFPFLIRDSKDRDAFIDWWNDNIKGTDKETGQVLFSIADNNFSNTARRTAAAVTTGLVPAKAKILVEQTIGVQKLYEAKMNYNIRKLHELANRNGMDWAVIEAGWDRMNKQKTLRANTGNKDVDAALGVIRTQIDDMSRQFKTLFSNAGVPLPKRLDDIITNNIGQYISRSYEIDYNKDYGKEYLAATKNDPKKKADLDNLIKFFNNGMSRDLMRAATLTDDQVKDLWDKVIGSGSTTVDEKRADLVNFAGNRKMTEITDALVNDVLRIGKGGRLAGFYRGASRDTSILKSKRDIPAEIRKVWGERTGVAEAAMTTVIRQARLLAETQMQADLLKRAPESFSDKATTELSERISPSTDKYGPLAGKYTTPEMKRFLEMRAEQYESDDALLFDVHSVATQDRAVANAAAKVLQKWRKGIGAFKAFTVLGEPINYLYNVAGMVQALGFKAPKDWSYTDSKGNKLSFTNWAGQFSKDLALGEVGPETTELYQQMVKYGLIGSALAGDIQEAFVRELRGNKSWTKTTWEKAGHVANVAFGGPEIMSSGVVLANEANFLRDLWTAQGRKFTFDELMQEAADRTKKSTISRDRAFRFAKAMDAYGASTYLTFFSETFRAPITNIAMAYKMMQDAKTMNPKAAKIANDYATRQFMAGAAGLALGYALVHGLAVTLGRGFGGDDDEVAEALPENMRTNVSNLVVLGEDSAGAKLLYDSSMANTYSALMNPLANIARGRFEDAGKEILDLQFVNPLIRQGIRAANDELGPSESIAPSLGNEALAWMGLNEYLPPEVVSRLPKMLAGAEPSFVAPAYDILSGKKTTQDFGGGMGAFLSLIGARPYRYSPQQAATFKINEVSDQYKEAVSNLNEVMRNRNSGKETVRAAVDRFYDEEYRIIQEAIPVFKAARAGGMNPEIMQQLMAPSGLKKSVRQALLTGNYQPTVQARNWLEISALSKIIQKPRKEQEEILEGYRRNRQLFDEVFQQKFGKKE